MLMEKPSLKISPSEVLEEYTDLQLWHIYVESARIRNRIILEFQRRIECEKAAL